MMAADKITAAVERLVDALITQRLISSHVLAASSHVQRDIEAQVADARTALTAALGVAPSEGPRHG
jgi:hypothetical protein